MQLLDATNQDSKHDVHIFSWESSGFVFPANFAFFCLSLFIFTFGGIVHFEAFAHDLTPNNNDVPGAPEWPEYGASRGQHIVFQGYCQGSHIEIDDFRQGGIELIIEQTTMGAQST